MKHFVFSFEVEHDDLIVWDEYVSASGMVEAVSKVKMIYEKHVIKHDIDRPIRVTYIGVTYS